MELLFDDCIIRYDGRQYILSHKVVTEKGNNVGKEYEVTLGYYSNADQLLNGLIRNGMANDSINGIIEIQKMIDAAVDKLKAS